jgi:hypothetical protein
MHKFVAPLLVGVFFLAHIASAHTSVPPLATLLQPTVSAFRAYADLGAFAIKVPTVVEVSFGNNALERYDFAVLDQENSSFEPRSSRQQNLVHETPLYIDTDFEVSSTEMLDQDPSTFSTFLLPANGQGRVEMRLTSSKSITSSALTMLLDTNVALPISIEIRAVVKGVFQTVLAATRMMGTSVQFPKTASDNWVIVFTYSQPLRISELRLRQDAVEVTRSTTVRFLAQPQHTYRIYFDSDRWVQPPVGEMGNLEGAKEVFVIKTLSPHSNPDFTPADVDQDAIPDMGDNCVSTPNTDQVDMDGNGRGDVCDDYDQDARINATDNCPDNPNRDQMDTDGDGVGDVCDSEESRITERYPWIPWAGIGFATLVLIVLLYLMLKPVMPRAQPVAPPLPLVPNPPPSLKQEWDDTSPKSQ